MRAEAEGIARGFGAAFRAQRLRAGLSQEELALECGFDRTYISGIERGARNPSIVAVVLLARGLGVPAGELFRDLDASSKGAG